METSGSIPRENKFEEGKEQPNDNHPTRNRELTDRNDKISSTRNQHNEKRKLEEDSSDSENEEREPSEPSEFMEDETSVIIHSEDGTSLTITRTTGKDGTSVDHTRTTGKDGTSVDHIHSKTREELLRRIHSKTREELLRRECSKSKLVAKSSLKDRFMDKVPVAKPVPPPPSPPVVPM